MGRREKDPKLRRRNKIARDLATKKYRQRVVDTFKNRKPKYPPSYDEWEEDDTHES